MEALRKGIAEAEAENVQEVLDVDLPDVSQHQSQSQSESQSKEKEEKGEGDSK